MTRLRRILSPGRLCFIGLAFLTAVGATPTAVQPSHVQKAAADRQTYFGPLFRYVIVYDDPALDGAGRDFRILMDPSGFSEANLRTLFVLLRERFKGLSAFTAYVETSLQDIQTPEQHDGPGSSEEPTDPKAFQHPSATIKHSPEADSLYMFVPSRRESKYPPAKIDLRIPPNN